MSTEYAIDAQGNYLGAYVDGAALPAGASLAPYAPQDARQTWNGSAWSAVPAPIPTPPTPREWLERLTADKQAAIAVAGATSGPILLWLLKAAGSPFIDVTLAETVAGVGALVTAGIITTADQSILLEL